jgi:exopolysaccharide biosynthesis predicted pyruvyltransferase EpsI
MADFLKLIQNAELVITDSFHGAALSISLNTNFMSIENKLNPLRIRNLMKRLDLSEGLEGYEV